MAGTVKVLTILTIAMTMSLPVMAGAQDYRNGDEARHDRKANEGFSTNRSTVGSDRNGGTVRYSMANTDGARPTRSTQEAEKQFRRGNDAYADGQYGIACISFRHAKNLFARSGDGQMSEAASGLARDACAIARANSSGTSHVYRSS